MAILLKYEDDASLKIAKAGFSLCDQDFSLSSDGMQLELWEKPVFWALMCVVEGGEGRSFKQVATVGCVEDFDG